MNTVEKSTSHIDYVLAAIAGLVSLCVVFSVPFPMSLLPVTGIFAITGYVISPALKKRQQATAELSYTPKNLPYINEH